MTPTIGAVPEDFLLALELARGKESTAKLIETVAKQTSDEAARWAFLQWSLRERAANKFARASEMWFVREALEQATHERVGAFHASRFPAGERVLDLTTGIGGDTIALANRGPTTGVDLDLERLNCAGHNLRVHGLVAELRHANALEIEADHQFYWCDPARRVAGRRSLRLDDFSPRVDQVLERLSSAKLGGFKLSPMLADSELASLGSQIEFISFGGECREALVWVGPLAGEGFRAVHIESAETLPRTHSVSTPLSEPSAYIFEADPAAIRAHALGALEARHNLSPLGKSNGYLTGTEKVDSPWLTGFEVLAHGKLDARWIKGLPYQVEAFKVRGVELDPAVWVKKVRTSSVERAIALVYPTEKGVRVAIAKRLI